MCTDTAHTSVKQPLYKMRWWVSSDINQMFWCLMLISFYFLISDLPFFFFFEITYICWNISIFHPFERDRQTDGRQSSIACDAFTYEEHSDSKTRHFQNRSAVLQFSETNSFVFGTVHVQNRPRQRFVFDCHDMCHTAEVFVSRRRSGSSCCGLRVMAAKAERVFLFSSESVNEGYAVHDFFMVCGWRQLALPQISSRSPGHQRQRWRPRHWLLPMCTSLSGIWLACSRWSRRRSLQRPNWVEDGADDFVEDRCLHAFSSWRRLSARAVSVFPDLLFFSTAGTCGYIVFSQFCVVDSREERT